ncbi:MAG TPA: WecB/TagA/CpsF family glycosyltransferase [bacterium]|nr:WecB/TagA/CpsF family glycosyltransferase [bacterium]
MGSGGRGGETAQGDIVAQRVNVLGVGVSAINMGQALAAIERWIARREAHYVCVTNIHGVIESQRDQDLRRIHNAAGLVTPDGMPLVWLGRIGGFKHMERVYGPDLMLALCERSVAKGYRHFFYGGGSPVPDRLAASLQRRYPGLRVAGAYAPPFRPLTEAEEECIVQRVNGAGADIVWVGLSTPKQEHWMAKHVGCLKASVLIGVGAAFDFHAGLKKQAPRWMQRSGSEWLFRLATEPKRLWRRYATTIPSFLWLCTLQTFRIREFRLEETVPPSVASGALRGLELEAARVHAVGEDEATTDPDL